MSFNPLPSRFWRLYHHPTVPEMHLEPFVAALGVPYRFQHPVPGTPWFADYAFPSLRVLLEIDGKSHLSPAAKEKDRARDEKTALLGWRTVRVTNQQALSVTLPSEIASWLGIAT